MKKAAPIILACCHASWSHASPPSPSPSASASRCRIRRRPGGWDGCTSFVHCLLLPPSAPGGAPSPSLPLPSRDGRDWLQWVAVRVSPGLVRWDPSLRAAKKGQAVASSSRPSNGPRSKKAAGGGGGSGSGNGRRMRKSELDDLVRGACVFQCAITVRSTSCAFDFFFSGPHLQSIAHRPWVAAGGEIDGFVGGVFSVAH